MKTISRRTMLRASGVALALPMLEVMTPGLAHAAATPRRMLNICCTLGLYTPSWKPATAGKDYAATEYLALIDEHRNNYTVFSGYSHEEQSGRQPHNSEITWLTSARHPGMDGFQNSISLDQTVANHYGYATRFPSLVLGTATPQSQSYTTSGVMVPAETSPSALFSKLFMQGTPEEVEREEQRLNDGASILDNLKTQTAALQKSASSGDRAKLEAYYEAVRTAEKELVEVKAWMGRPKPVVDMTPPIDNPDRGDLLDRIRLMYSLIPLILQTDSTRVISLMVQDHSTAIRAPGVTGDQHGLSHHGQDEAKIAQLRTIEREIVKLLGGLLTALQSMQDPDGSVLDQTTVLFGSNLGNANSHAAKDLPILVAGGGFGPGSHVVHDGEYNGPLCNLYVTLLRSMGFEVDQFGQSTGALTWS